MSSVRAVAGVPCLIKTGNDDLDDSVDRVPCLPGTISEEELTVFAAGMQKMCCRVARNAANSVVPQTWRAYPAANYGSSLHQACDDTPPSLPISTPLLHVSFSMMRLALSERFTSVKWDYKRDMSQNQLTLEGMKQGVRDSAGY